MARRLDILINAKGGTQAMSTFRQVGQSISRMGMMASAAVPVALLKATNEAVKFEHQMAGVGTMLKDNVGPQVAAFSDQIQDMSVEFGQSKETLSKGLYDILSAGVDASQAIDVLKNATKAAIGGFTEAEVAVDGVTTVLNAFRLSGKKSSHVLDLMFNTVREGKITFQELAENISKLAPLAEAAGLDVRDMFAAVATAVKIEKPERAMTAIRAALVSAAKKGEDFLDVLRDLRGASLDQILAAGYDKQAAQGITLLAGNYKEFVKQIGLSRSAAGAAEEAFKKMSATSQMQVNQMKQAFNSAFTDMGQAIVDTGLLAHLKDIAVAISDISKESRRMGRPVGAEMSGKSVDPSRKPDVIPMWRHIVQGYMETINDALSETPMDLTKLPWAMKQPGHRMDLERSRALWEKQQQAAEEKASKKQLAALLGRLDKDAADFAAGQEKTREAEGRANWQEFRAKMRKQLGLDEPEINLPKMVIPGAGEKVAPMMQQGPQQGFTTRFLSGLSGLTNTPAKKTEQNTRAIASNTAEANNILEKAVESVKGMREDLKSFTPMFASL